MELIIYSPTYTPRSQYVFRQCFEVLHPLNWRTTRDLNTYLQADGVKINYSDTAQDPAEFWIKPAGLLAAGDIASIKPMVKWEQDLPWFFGEAGEDFPGDLFSQIFYLLSRYEEYLPFKPDRHNRFTAANSLAQTEGFLHLPVVEHWLLLLRKKVLARFPGFDWPFPSYEFVSTVDIDRAFSMQYLENWRYLAGIARDLLGLRFVHLYKRWKAWFEVFEDPYFSIPSILEWHKAAEIKCRYFFLVADYGKHDINNPVTSPIMRSLIKMLSGHQDYGVHPSYASNKDPERILMEKKRVEDFGKIVVEHSRQHFLMLRFPQTYRSLMAAGIKHDHSMGYADNVGFRAGVSRPYQWYDLEEEASKDFWIHPFAAMDVTLRSYLKLKPAQAEEKMTQLREQCLAVGGHFCILWHNSSFFAAEGWKGWPEVYERVVKRK
jgi:hypothetical protein